MQDLKPRTPEETLKNVIGLNLMLHSHPLESLEKCCEDIFKSSVEYA